MTFELEPTLESTMDKVVEEASEVIQAIQKVKRFGMHNFHPETKVYNSVALMDEILQLEEELKKLKGFIPKPTLQEMVQEVLKWYQNSSIKQQYEFSSSRFEDLPIYHSTLGRSISNAFNLWVYPWEKRIIEGVDMSDEHPDAISMRVIEEVWRRVKDD